MATGVRILLFIAFAITVLPPAPESLAFRLDNGQRHFKELQDLNDESTEEVGQTDGGDQESEEGSSEEEAELESSLYSMGSSIGVMPPTEPPGPVDPGQGGPDPGNPGGGGGGGGGGVPEAPVTSAPTAGPPLITMPPVVNPTTPMRGDGGFLAFDPSRVGSRGDIPLNEARPAKPKLSDNILAISGEREKPIYPSSLPVPLGALLTVVIIGGLVVVLAVGGVAYFFATRVRIS